MSDGTVFTSHDRIVGDTLSPLYFALTQSGTAYNLTGATVASKFVNVKTRTATAGTAAITTAASGYVTVPLTGITAVTGTAGDYEVYVTVTSGGATDHYPADGGRIILRVHAL